MAVINSASLAYALMPEVSKWYGTKYAEYSPQYPKIFSIEKSSRAFEEEVGVTGSGLMSIKPEGEGISYDSFGQGYMKRYTHVTYGIGFIITQELIEDDLYDIVGKQRARALALSVRWTKEVLGANVLNRAFNSSYTGADGKELCATDHPNKSGGTWRNELSTSADLSEYALEQAVIDIAAFTTDRGMPFQALPKKVVIPPALQFVATRILKSELQSNSANNDTNALRTMGLIPEIVVNHYLTDTDAWFILTDAPDGLKYKERRSDAFAVDGDFDTENAKFKATFRGIFAWTDPRCIFGSPGA